MHHQWMCRRYWIYFVFSFDFFFFKQKTPYEMRISDWSSDVCSSDLPILFDRDEGIRGDSSMEGLAKLRPVHAGGVTTAGNSSQQNDAASARTAERRVGKACVSTGRSRWPPAP